MHKCQWNVFRVKGLMFTERIEGLRENPITQHLSLITNELSFTLSTVSPYKLFLCSQCRTFFIFVIYFKCQISKVTSIIVMI